MSKRTMILAFVSIAIAFIAYLSFKHDKENIDIDLEPEETEPEETEPEETEPEEKTARPPKLKKVKDEPISEEKTDTTAGEPSELKG